MHNLCTQCGETLKEQSRFCGNCGTLADVTLVYQDPFKSKTLRLIFSYYGAALLLCLVCEHMNVFEGLNGVFITDVLFIIITVAAASFNAGELRPLISVRILRPVPVFWVLLATAGFSLFVNVTVPYINKWLLNQDLNYYWVYADSIYPFAMMVLSVAVVPAIFEELAFRGFMLNSLISLTNTKTALTISSFLFALLHLSFISFFWLLPFAFFLGWLRLKYNTMWYGILSHFLFNTITCIFNYYQANPL